MIVVVAGHLFGRESRGDNASVYRQEVCLLGLRVIIFMIVKVMITTKTDEGGIVGDIDLETG